MCWVFIAAHELLLVVASRGNSLVLLRLLVVDSLEKHRLWHVGFSSFSPQSQWLWPTGLVACITWNHQTHVHCIGRQIPIHWTTREVPQCFKRPVRKYSVLTLNYSHKMIPSGFLFFRIMLLAKVWGQTRKNSDKFHFLSVSVPESVILFSA